MFGVKGEKESMKKIIGLMIVLFIAIVCANRSFAEDASSSSMKKEPFLRFVEKVLGKDQKIVRVEDREASPVHGLKQVRVWFESVYGETPILFYVTDDGSKFIAGSMFDAEGNNLSKKAVGETKPRTIPLADMELHKEYMFGLEEAAVKIVLWTGTDVVSLIIFDTLYKLYEKNKDKVALYLKFYPTSKADLKQDMYRAFALSCFKNEKLTDGIAFLKGTAPTWGRDRNDFEAFRKEKGFLDCDGEVVRQDMDLSKKLRLPFHQVVFVNGTILLEDVTKENIEKLSGAQLD